MEKYDLVKEGVVVKEKVRRNVSVSLNGVNIKYHDVTKISDVERKEGGIYERIDPAPIYNGLFEIFGDKSAGVVNDSDGTVTYTTPIIPLDIETCRTNLIKVIHNHYRSACDLCDHDHELDATKSNHLSIINSLSTREEIINYDPCSLWSVNHAQWRMYCGKDAS